jgi:AraC-like DNA-binding protein
MDALSDMLRVAHMTGGVYLHAEFTAPWCLSGRLTPERCAPFLGPAAHLIQYHYVVDGESRLRIVGEEEEIRLVPGDLVLLPRNEMHLMGSDLGLAPAPGSEVIQPCADGGLSAIRLGGGGAATRMVCGYLGTDSTALKPLIAALPSVIRLKTAENGDGAWIRSTFQFAADEVVKGRPGSETVLAKLSELLFVESVRRYAETLPDDATGWLAGLRDPYVARTLALFHRDVGRVWTHDALSREVGLSRSALADRFGRLVGTAPMQYLANWRMQVAAQKLRGSTASLAQIADGVGYHSEAAFSRAFKKSFGTAPGAWRRSPILAA